MPRPAPLPASLGAAFACGDALALGVTRGRLRAADLVRPHRGVRVAPFIDPHPDDDRPGAIDRRRRRALMHRIAGYECTRRPHTFYAGRTALGIFDLPFAAASPLVVGAFGREHPPRAEGVIGIWSSPALVTTVIFDGLPVSSPASTWAMLAGELSERELTVLGDAIVRIPRGRGGRPEPERQLATIEHLRAAAMAPRRRHRAKLLRALARVRVGSMSVLESEHRLNAADAGLPEPELDVEIRDERGVLIGIADLVHHRARVIVEIEGDQHRVSRAQWNRDLEKYAAYAALGWQVVRLSSTHVRSRGRDVELVRAALARAVD